MASKVMLSASRTPNSDHSLHPQNPISSSSSSSSSSLHQLHSDPSRNFGSMNMDEILKNIYSDSDPFASETSAAVTAGVTPSVVAAVAGGGDVGPSKTVDEVWREIVAAGGGGGGGSREPEMTLEDFLTKAGAVTEEDVRVPVIAPPPPPPPPSTAAAPAAGRFVVDNMMGTGNCQFPVAMQNGPGGYGMEPPPHMGYGNGVMGIAGSGSGRGKRRSTVEELPADKATQQKQRRMIKNRESAARSRERKQAYTVELESLVTQLEEENARLLREEEEKNKERLKQIMENLIPVVEKRKPPRVLRRFRSMSW